MSFKRITQAPPLWIEIRSGSVHVHNGREGRDLPATWNALGAPDATTRQSLLDAFSRLAPRKPWQIRGTLWCAMSARGVSLRAFDLPEVPTAEFHRVLRLQVEAGFPLPPEQLSWGLIRHSAGSGTEQGVRRCRIAAIRRDLLEGLASFFSEAGFEPIFTVAALVRTEPFDGSPGECTTLELRARTSERVDLEDGSPLRIRVVDWGHARLAEAVAADVGCTAAEAAGLVGDLAEARELPASRRDAVDGSVHRAILEFAAAIRRVDIPMRLRLSGAEPWATFIGSRLATALAPTSVEIRPDGVASPGLTGAVAAMQSSGEPVVRLAADDPMAGGEPRRPDTVPWKWVVRAAALALALGLFPYAEAFIASPFLSRRLDRLSKDRVRLGEIDRRLDFLQHVSDSQPPYIDAAYVIANASPSGLRFDSVSMNQRGEVSVSGYTQMPQQVVEFRTRLVDSGFFSTVVLEELAPVAGGQPRINLRLTAQWKAAAQREALKLGPVVPDRPSTNLPPATYPAPAASNLPAAKPPAKP